MESGTAKKFGITHDGSRVEEETLELEEDETERLLLLSSDAQNEGE